MKDCPLDLHLDEDGRFALTDEELNERLIRFEELDEKAVNFRKKEKKIQNEIKRLSLRLTFAKKAATKKSLTKKIESLQASLKKDYPLITLDEARKTNLIYDLRYTPGDSKLPECDAVAGFSRVSDLDTDFYFKHEDLIKSLELFSPDNPPSLYERLARARREFKFKIRSKNDTFYEDVILPKVSLSGWVRAVCRISRAIPTLVQLIDNELNLISRRPEEFSANGFSTVRLLERFTSRLRLKEQYLNVFVLAKEFEKVLKNKFERQVYDCLIKKSKKIKNTIDPSRVRTAYRHRGEIVNKIKACCVKKGYDKEWFMNHFGDLPPIKKLLTVEFEKEALRVKEFAEDRVDVSGDGSKRYEISGTGPISLDDTKKIHVDDEIYSRMKAWELLGMTREEFYS